MIVKPREEPLRLKKLQALHRRIPKKHPKYSIIKEQLAKQAAGYKGEKSVDYPLSFLSERNYFIFHDIRLLQGNYFFQIDSLLLSPFFILILEIKHIVGTLFFDPNFHQLIRTNEGREEAFPDPLIQLERHERQLREWLINHKFPDVPITSLLVSSHPNSILRTTSENLQIAQKVIRQDFLPFKIDQFQDQYTEENIPLKELKRLIHHLQIHHSPADPAILDQFHIQKEQVCRGVFCPHCNDVPMKRIKGSWSCSYCHLKDKNAHIAALKDYGLLIQSTITNQEARDFLQITSSSVVNKLLKSLELPYNGVNKGRMYDLRTLADR